MVLGYGSGFIDAQHGYPGQCLDALHIVDEDFLHGEAHGAHGQCNAGSQVEAFGDHSDDGCYHVGNAVAEIGLQYDVLLVKEQGADGYDDHANDFDQAVQGADHFRLLSAFLPGCLEGQPGNVAVFAHGGQACAAAAGDDKTAGHQFGSFFFGHLIRLTRQQGLIYLDLAGQHHGVGRDLIAGTQLDNVVDYQIFGQDLPPFRVTNDLGVDRVHDIQLVQHLLGAKLLHNTDQGIADNDTHEHHVPVGSHDRQQHRQDHENHIKIGQGIASDDFLDGPGVRIHRPVVPAGQEPGLHLLFVQTLVGIRRDALDPAAVIPRCIDLFLFQCHSRLSDKTML